MSNLGSFSRLRKVFVDDGNHHNNKQLDYDPRCGKTKEEVEWRWAQHEKLCQRMPQALHELRTQAKEMRQHFLDHPDDLRKWDKYADNVDDAFANHLQHALSSPVYTPYSVLYEQLMKRKARSRSLAGKLDKLKQAAAAMNKGVGRSGLAAAAGVVAGLAVGSTLWNNKQQQTKET